ncbi:MAG: MAPEG family protein [Gammaproteobacteria bacterium]|nr:MAPEG family protein [Gammaproteobacteria bacterium]
MNNLIILQPMIGMMLLTFAVWTYLFAVRIPAMQKRRLPTQTYTTPDKARELLPEAAAYPANNLKNLFELPVLFYALCLMLFVTDTVDAVYVAAAWGFLGFRILHSLIHCTINRVMARFLCYLAASVLLWFMVVRAAIDLLGG